MLQIIIKAETVEQVCNPVYPEQLRIMQVEEVLVFIVEPED
jgi:hypothetical protein